MAPVFILLLAIIFNGHEPPAIARMDQPDLETCLTNAKKFVEQDPKSFDAEGLSAACIKKLPGDVAL